MGGTTTPASIDVERAAALLAAGAVVAFPTETVYGLGADAASPSAVRKVFALKGRPPDHPLIVHLRSAAQLLQWAAEVPRDAHALVDAFWPGPLTLILRKASSVPLETTGGQSSVGLRCPSHPLAQALLSAFAVRGSGAIAAPSANRFGRVSATTAAHVREEFGDSVPVLDGGEATLGLESTILDLSRGVPVLLRPGAITREDIARVLGAPPRDRDADAPRASGALASHYAPVTPVTLLQADDIGRAVAAAAARGERLAVLARTAPPAAGALAWHAAPLEAGAYAHQLYAALRALDANRADRIVVEGVPDGQAWEAVRDRLARAAAGDPDANEP